ncbi:MAG: glycosyltransferase family 2 protein [Haloarculaceae archaeon]
MYRGKTVAVVVPAYNEEGLVGSVIQSIPEFVDRIYAVDDCSTDGTWEEILGCVRPEDAEAGAAADATEAGSTAATADGGHATPRVVPVRHEENSGVGAAIKTGYRRARAEEMDVTAVVNGDGQMDPSILERFVEPVAEGQADYAKGDRLRSRELHADMSAWRLTGNVLLTFLTKIASGYWGMNDPQNGYTAISLSALERLDLERLYDDYGFLNDLLVALNARDCRVADVPMTAVYGDEESGIAYSSFVPRLSALLLRDFCWRLKVKYFVLDFHPLVLFYLLGAVGGVLGVAYGLWAHVSRASLLASGVAILICLVSAALVLFAMVFDMQHNDHLHRDVAN